VGEVIIVIVEVGTRVLLSTGNSVGIIVAVGKIGVEIWVGIFVGVFVGTKVGTAGLGVFMEVG